MLCYKRSIFHWIEKGQVYIYTSTFRYNYLVIAIQFLFYIYLSACRKSWNYSEKGKVNTLKKVAPNFLNNMLNKHKKKIIHPKSLVLK